MSSQLSEQPLANLAQRNQNHTTPDNVITSVFWDLHFSSTTLKKTTQSLAALRGPTGRLNVEFVNKRPLKMNKIMEQLLPQKNAYSKEIWTE